MSFLTLQSASDVPDLDVEDLLPFGEVFHNRRQLLARALQTLRHHPTVEIESVLRAIYQLAESLQSLEDALETRGDVEHWLDVDHLRFQPAGSRFLLVSRKRSHLHAVNRGVEVSHAVTGQEFHLDLRWSKILCTYKHAFALLG